MIARLAVLVLLGGCAGETSPPPAPVSTHVGDWRDQVIYEVLVDRFDNGDPENDAAGGAVPVPGDLARHQGGDWVGLASRLDYLQRLGVTALWISPIVDNVVTTETEDGYHGYWGTDFTRPNPRFGTLPELRALVDEAHDRGMLVIVDIVTNHAGRVFDYDLDRDGAPGEGEIEPPYSAGGPYEAPLLWRVDGSRLAGLELGPDQFRRRGRGDIGDDVERVLGDFPTGLRDLDTERDDVFSALVETYVGWVEATDVDGFRIDAVPHVEAAFWPRFCATLRERLVALGKERFLLLGEVFTASGPILARYTEDGGLDAMLDFAVKFHVVDSVILDGLEPTRAVAPLERDRSLYPDAPHPLGVGLTPWEARVAFADNHDLWRIRGEIDDPAVAGLALVVAFTLDAIPAVYYGTEQELTGQGSHGSREVLWESGFDETTTTFRFIARLADLRRRLPSLRYGSLRVAYAAETGGRDSDARDAGLLAWEREHEGERVLVALNSHAFQPSSASIPTGFPAGVVLRDLLSGSDQRWLVRPGGAVELTLRPRVAVLLAPQ